MDIWSKEKRSEVMGRIGSKDTKPELKLRSLFYAAGLRYRLHKKDLPGKPDLVFPKYKVVVFIHGCFWHFHKECREGRIPNSNTKFWTEKLSKNIDRDEKNQLKLKEMGWKVLIVWECEIERGIYSKNVDELILAIKGQ